MFTKKARQKRLTKKQEKLTKELEKLEAAQVQAQQAQTKALKKVDTIIKEKEPFEIHSDTPPIDHVKHGLMKMTHHRPVLWFKRRFKKGSLIYANIEFLNGIHTTYAVLEKWGRFKFNKCTYIIDDDYKYYNKGLRGYCLDYHEGIALPIKRKIPANKIHKGLQELNPDNIAYAINPRTLHTFMMNEVIESTIVAVQLTKFFRSVRGFTIVTMVLVFIHLVLYSYREGVFQGIAGSVGLG